MDNWWDKYETVESNDSPAETPVAQPDTGERSSSWWDKYETVEVKQKLDGNALSRGISRGADMAGQFYGSTLESIGQATGLESLEESGRARAARNRAELQASTPSMTTEDIDGVGSLGSFVGEKLGETAVPMATSIGTATAAGAAAGSIVPGIGTLAGALVGAGAATLANLPYMFGSFRERQKDEDIAAGRQIEVDDSTALLYALPASALDSVSDLFIVGKLAKPFKPLLESSSLLTRVTTNAATGATVESLTEVGQTVLERQQAGLSLTDDEAQNEYFEAAVAGGLIGGAASAATSVRKPTVEDVGGGTDAEQRAALNGATTRTETGEVSPDQAAALGSTPAPAQTAGEKTREILERMRAKRAAADPMSDEFEAPGRKTPPPAPASDLTPEQRVAANQQAAVDLNVTAAPPVTPAGNVAPVAQPVSAPTAQVEIPTEQVAPAPVIPEPADAPITEGTELEETVLADTALNEDVPEGAEAAGDTLPTIPEAPETLAAQGESLVDRKSKRKAVYIPPETLGEVDADALPSGKNIYTMTLPNGGQLFWNYTKIGLGKKDVTKLYNDGNLGKLLGLGPFNKAEVAASGGTQDLAVVERNADGVPVKDVAATEVTVPEQVAALEAEKDAGSTIEVKPAAEVIAERQAAPKAAAAKAKSKGRAEAPVRTLKDIDPEEVARIEAAANAKPAPKAETVIAASKARTEAPAPAPTKSAPKTIVAGETRIAIPDAKKPPAFARKGKWRIEVDADGQAFAVISAEDVAEERKAADIQRNKDRAAEDKRKEDLAKQEAKDAKNEDVRAEDSDRRALADSGTIPAGEEEARARISLGDKKGTTVQDQYVENAKKAENLAKTLRPKVTLEESAEETSETEGDGEAEAVSESAALTKYLDGIMENLPALQASLEQTMKAVRAGRVGLPKQVTGNTTNAVVWFKQTDATLKKLARLKNTPNADTSRKIRAEIRDFLSAEYDYLTTGSTVRLRDLRKNEGEEGTRGGSAPMSADSSTEPQVVDENGLNPEELLLRKEEESETSDDYELVPSTEPVRAIEIDETIPAFTANVDFDEEGNPVAKSVSKVAKVEVRKSRASARAAAQQAIRAKMSGDTLSLDAAEKPLGKDSDEKLVETLRPDDILGLEIIDRITSSGKALGDMTLAERTALFKDVDGVDPERVEESIAVAKIPLSRFQTLLERQSFLRALSRNLKFMDAMPAAIQKALGTDLLAQMNRIAGDVEVLIVDDADMPALAPGKDGYFWPRGDYIVIRASLFDDVNAARLQHTVTHEAGHAALWHAIKSNPRLRRQLEAVLGASKKFADRMGIKEFSNGLRDADEFASELVSNPRFQDFLASVTLSKTDLLKLGIRPSLAAQVRNALDAIKIKLLDAIGWSDALRSVGMDPNTPNALTAGLDIIGNLLDVAPGARTRFQQMIAESGASLGKDSDTGIYGRLKERGLDDEQALNVSAIIDEEFGGTATDEELDALVGALGKPVGSQQGLTGPSPFMPPKLPGRVAKVLNWNPSKASKANKAILYASTLDFIDTSFRKYFGDKAGNALTDYVNAAFKFRKVADDIAALHDLDFADFEDLRKAKPAEAAKIQKLVAMLEAVDIDISDGATNDHLKKTNARRYLQSKAALPEVQKIIASMDPETLALTRRMAKNFTTSHNEYIRSVTETILDGLSTPLSKSVRDRIIDNVVNGKLDSQDKTDVNDDAVYAMLERSEFLKKRKGSYFPAERFGEHVVLTELAIADPKITSVVTKSGRKNVPVTTQIDGGTVRFIFDYTVRGSNPAVTKKVYDWVAKNDLPLSSYVVKYRDRQTGEIVGKGDMDITKDYDMVHEVSLQNKGVHFFENDADAYAFEAQAATDKAAGKLLSHSTVLPKHTQTHREHLIPPGALTAVFSSIDKNTNLTAERKEQLKNAARDAITRNMVGNRYEKRLMGRQNIIGASDEVGRAAAYYGRSVGNAIAQIRSGGERADALARMRAVADSKRNTPGEGNTVGLVVNEIVTREGLDMGPTQSWQLLDNLSTINSVDKLLSPANWFLNAMQVSMNSMPFIGGRFGNVKSARALLSAYQRTGAAGAAKSGLKNTGKAVTQVGKSRVDLDDVLGSIRKNVGSKYDAMFEELISTNDITDNVGIENAAQLAGGRGAVGTALVKMDRIMRAMPNAIEAINRSVSAVATYDLAIGSGMSQADAIAYTREMLRRTQFRYDETNKSRLMRETPALRFFFTFKQYGQGQYQMLADALSRALKDASPAERAMARKQLYTTFAMQVAVAGVFSFPAIEIIKTVVMLGAAMGLGDGWEEEVVDPLRELARETFGMTIEEIASKGIMSKILGVDLSGRMSWADLIVGYPPKSSEKQDLLAWIGNAIAGPQGGLVYDMFFGAPKALLEGDFAKALTMALPVKAASDTVKAGAGVVDGKMSPLDAGKQVLGFKSLRQSRIDDAKGKSIRESGRKKKEVNSLIGDYLNAVSRGDVAKAAAAIRDYNKSLGKDEREISLKGLEKRRRESAQAYQE